VRNREDWRPPYARIRRRKTEFIQAHEQERLTGPAGELGSWTESWRSSRWGRENLLHCTRQEATSREKISFSTRSNKIIQPSSTNGGDQKRQGEQLDSLTSLTGAKRLARRKGQIQTKQLNEVGNEVSTESKQARGTGSTQEQRRTEPSPGWLQHKSDWARSCAAGEFHSVEKLTQHQKS
jgi:hypothetical protein